MNVGVIGLGSVWATYGALLPKVRRPAQLVAVYDPVTARARQAAKELDAAFVTGVQALASRPDVAALLVMDVGWMGASVLDLLVGTCKPIFSGAWLAADGSSYERWSNRTTTEGTTIVPPLWRRYMPSTSRLMELAATELGGVETIELSLGDVTTLTPAARQETLIGWIDFARYVIRASMEGAEAGVEFSNSGEATFRINFGSAATSVLDAKPRRLEMRMAGVNDLQQWRAIVAEVASPPAASPLSFSPRNEMAPQTRIQCARGSAVVEDRQTIGWTSASGERQDESLSVERSEAAVLLDLFLRRAQGGLIPLADFNDVVQAMTLLNASAVESSVGVE